MLERIKQFTKKHKKEIIRIGVFTLIITLRTTCAYAAGAEVAGSEKLDGIINFICGWFTKIGFVVAFVGAFQFALAFKSDDANGKTNGIRMVASGLMAAGIGASKSLFF